ncbi:LytTR family DNA-binding domain-containing protein [Cellulosilyticum lentocellum]|uniref:Response regulator receiver protein n=1 Tax=Cellulosilyticum lentocellum (strain ATCC 49066 / DSM 5427 / NCIMB 11756 / RHM5) TaxID=642492 RepID=F2JQP9_CELLD|nr:LytTR family DNA-binding domain-containing protein [Cellulosilyticum lentocellum]ADZ82644.1 response regulator receiver protein [Cellulosilyticum lentocellum DSM 5427]
MKIHIDTQIDQNEIEVIIRCKEANEEVKRIQDLLELFNKKLKGIKDQQIYILDVIQILYIDTVDKRTFLYTAGDIYESNLKLYELEELLETSNFFRAGKSIIINFSHIKRIKPDFGGRLEVTISNEEKLYVSRQYAIHIKERLGKI